MSTTTRQNDRRSKRNPERTREAILEVAGKLLAKDGPEGLAVSQVAQLAGVNRGTAYHHFQTREQLLEATKTWVSTKLCKEVFGDESQAADLKPHTVIENLSNFAMENPEFGRAWLFELLSSEKPGSDPFWDLYKSKIDAFVESDQAQPGIDSEVHTVMMLASVFLWPVWARAHSSSAAARKKMAKRFADELLRLELHGILNPEQFPDIEPETTKRKPARRRKNSKK